VGSSLALLWAADLATFESTNCHSESSGFGFNQHKWRGIASDAATFFFFDEELLDFETLWMRTALENICSFTGLDDFLDFFRNDTTPSARHIPWFSVGALVRKDIFDEILSPNFGSRRENFTGGRPAKKWLKRRPNRAGLDTTARDAVLKLLH
jgi:hypothetical protein